jgi:hypothetical protein
MKNLKLSVLSFAMLFASTAFGQNLNRMTGYGDPAVIEVVASSAKVTNVSGKLTITLNDVDKLAAIATNLHQKNRLFDAFPVSELPKAWNSCNAMKEEKKLWNEDGLNSIVIFHSGADSDSKNTHLAKAPLVTAPKDKTRTSGADEGIARLMLINAKLANNDLSFDIPKGVIAAGSYTRVRVLTECIIFPGQPMPGSN